MMTHLLPRGQRRPVRRYVDELLGGQRASEPRSAAEGATQLLAVSSVLALDSRLSRGLERGARKVERRAGAAAVSRVDLESFRYEHGDDVVDRHADASSRRAEELARSPRGRRVRPGVMHAIDLLIVCIEMSFWYMLAAGSFNDDATLLDRLPGVLVAVFIPLGGVLAARLAGMLGASVLHRPKESDQRWPAAGAFALLLVAAGTTYHLVDWRYSDGVPIGDTELPSVAMGLLFALILLVIALMHATVVDHAAQEDRARARRLRGPAREHRRLETALIRSQSVYTSAWMDLASRVDRALDQAERLLITGEIAVLAARTGSGSAEAPSNSGLFREGVAETPLTTAEGWRLASGGPAVGLHAIARAVDLLTRYPIHQDAEAPADPASSLTQRLQALFVPRHPIGDASAAPSASQTAKPTDMVEQLEPAAAAETTGTADMPETAESLGLVPPSDPEDAGHESETETAA